MDSLSTDATGVKHTPGPWHVDDQLRVLDAGQNEICLPAIAAQLTECSANARLIAAAPDMLAALKEIVAYFAVDIEDFEEDDEKFLAFQRSRAAIAKAEGR